MVSITTLVMIIIARERGRNNAGHVSGEAMASIHEHVKSHAHQHIMDRPPSSIYQSRHARIYSHVVIKDAHVRNRFLKAFASSTIAGIAASDASGGDAVPSNTALPYTLVRLAGHTVSL